MKIEEYVPESEPDHHREGEVLQGRAAEDEEHRHQEDARQTRDQRPGQNLAHRAVDDLGEGRARQPRHVLAYSVEHDDRVVERVTKDGEEGGDGTAGHLPPRQGVDATRDQDVVDHGDDHRHRVLRFEPERDVAADHQQGEDDRLDRAPRHLLAEGRADGRRVEAVGDDAVLRLERRLDALDRLRARLRVDLEDVRPELLVRRLGDLGVVDPGGLDRRADVVHGRGLLQPDRDPAAALEVDAQVELLGREGERADQQDAARQREEVLARPAEVEVPADPLLRAAPRAPPASA